MDCSENRPCSIYLELSAVVANGRKVFVSGNLHGTAGTLESILLGSSDGGVSWKEATPRIQGAAIELVQFYDLQHGWAAGELQYPLPHDPFFLVSTDGGESWRRKPVTSGGGSGSVQTFSFDSVQHGELIVDSGKGATGGRYGFFESQTGGDSWMIRSATGEMPRLKHPAPETDSWRLKPDDTSSKTWKLEQKENDVWTVVAEFPIEVGQCPVLAPAADQL